MTGAMLVLFDPGASHHPTYNLRVLPFQELHVVWEATKKFAIFLGKTLK